MKQRIVLLGPPASGKGTQAELMQARYQIPITSPGAILREERKLGTALGIEAEKATIQGKLVDDSIVNAVVKNWLERHDSAFIFDGYPRSSGQAIALDEMLGERNTPIEIVLSLVTDRETIRARIARRMLCSSCGRTFGVGLHVASPDTPCPACGGMLTRRSDDAPETLELRLREYAAKTEPLIDYYGKQGLLRSVDATDTPDAVCDSIARILEER